MSLAIYQDLINAGIPDIEQGGHWTAMLESGETWAKNYCNRDLVYAGYTQTGTTNANGNIWLKEIPVDTDKTITVTVNDTVLTSDEYELDATNGKLEVYLANVEYEVTYTGGNDTIPQAIKNAVCLLANHYHLKAQQGNMSSQNVGAVTYNYADNDETLKPIKELLAPYRFIVI